MRSIFATCVFLPPERDDRARHLLSSISLISALAERVLLYLCVSLLLLLLLLVKPSMLDRERITALRDFLGSDMESCVCSSVLRLGGSWPFTMMKRPCRRPYNAPMQPKEKKWGPVVVDRRETPTIISIGRTCLPASINVVQLHTRRATTKRLLFFLSLSLSRNIKQPTKEDGSRAKVFLVLFAHVIRCSVARPPSSSSSSTALYSILGETSIASLSLSNLPSSFRCQVTYVYKPRDRQIDRQTLNEKMKMKKKKRKIKVFVYFLFDFQVKCS